MALVVGEVEPGELAVEDIVAALGRFERQHPLLIGGGARGRRHQQCGLGVAEGVGVGEGLGLGDGLGLGEVPGLGDGLGLGEVPGLGEGLGLGEGPVPVTTMVPVALPRESSIW